MSKTVRKNEIKNDNENILYLSENDANALGIFEDSIQRVYVDDREVEVVFVDEHEIIPATSEERKIYNEAEKLAQKYLALNSNKNNLQPVDEGYVGGKRTHWWNKFRPSKNAKANSSSDMNSYEYDSYVNESSSRNSRALKPVTRVNSQAASTYDNYENDYENDTRAKRREQILKERQELRQENERLSRARKDPSRTNKFTVRSDVFTEEELEVLQGIISKSKNSNTSSSKKSSTKKTKSSKIKTIKRK